MTRQAIPAVALLLVTSLAAAAERPEVGRTDWPWWRGPQRNGIALAGQSPPLLWSASQNIVWKSPVPGRGHGSATVVGDHVFLTTFSENELQTRCYRRQDR